MRYPVEETAEKHRKLVEAAAEMLRAKGLDGVSVSDVMKAAGMTHGAFYSHFDSKDQMAEAVMTWITDQSDEQMVKTLASSREPRKAVLADYLAKDHRDNPGCGCIMPTLAIDAARQGIGRGAITRQVRRWLDRATKGFAWKKGPQRREQAILTFAAMVGAIVLARAVDDPELSDEILAATRDQLAS